MSLLRITIDNVRYDQSATLSCTISMRSTHQYLRDRLCSGSVTILFGGTIHCLYNKNRFGVFPKQIAVYRHCSPIFNVREVCSLPP